MTISGGRTEQLYIIAGFLPHYWLYKWFSQFHSCGTYLVRSRSPSVRIGVLWVHIFRYLHMIITLILLCLYCVTYVCILMICSTLFCVVYLKALLVTQFNLWIIVETIYVLWCGIFYSFSALTVYVGWQDICLGYKNSSGNPQSLSFAGIWGPALTWSNLQKSRWVKQKPKSYMMWNLYTERVISVI